MTIQSSFVMFLILLAVGRWQCSEAKCHFHGDSIVCSKESSSHRTEVHSKTESSVKSVVVCSSKGETHSSGEIHKMNCQHMSSAYSQKMYNKTTPSKSHAEMTNVQGKSASMEEPTPQAQASESSPDIDEPRSFVATDHTVPSVEAAEPPTAQPFPMFTSEAADDDTQHRQGEKKEHSTSIETEEPVVVVQVAPPVSPSPVPVVAPAVISPSPVQSVPAMPSPEPQQIVHPPPVIVPSVVKKTNVSEVVTKKVKSAIDSGNFSAVAHTVVHYDDLYGLTQGFTFSKEDKKSALTRTPQRNKDSDVVAIKGLLSAALDPKTKSKVIQLLVLSVTSPKGYHFTQFRALVEELTKIVEDEDLLKEVIAANPRTYSRRMLLCASCTPVYSLICAHCWPQKVCRAYFWCPGSHTSFVSSSSSQKKVKVVVSEKTQTASKEIEKGPERIAKNEENKEKGKPEIEAEASVEAQKPELKKQESTPSKSPASHEDTISKARYTGNEKKTGKSERKVNPKEEATNKLFKS